MEATEEQIRAWVRSEQERIDTEKQEACDHLVSGTLQPDKSVTCNDCGKNLIFDPDDAGSMAPNKATDRYFGSMREL